jgi:hypothetical protein
MGDLQGRREVEKWIQGRREVEKWSEICVLFAVVLLLLR